MAAWPRKSKEPIMATKRKTKRFTVGGMSEEDVASFAGTPENDSNAGMAPTPKNDSNAGMASEAGMMEKEPEENFKPTPKAKAPIVTKEQLAKSGLSLRDYMNKQQGLTRRGAGKDELSSVASSRAAAYKEAEAKARTPEARAERQKQIESQAVERVTPEANMLPMGSVKTLATIAKGMAGRHAAKGVDKLAEYSTPILEGGRKMLPGAMKQIGMKKGGAVKSSSASRRADGIATKGKTRGRYL
jgi:hypothetical protein